MCLFFGSRFSDWTTLTTHFPKENDPKDSKQKKNVEQKKKQKVIRKTLRRAILRERTKAEPEKKHTQKVKRQAHTQLLFFHHTKAKKHDAIRREQQPHIYTPLNSPYILLSQIHSHTHPKVSYNIAIIGTWGSPPKELPNTPIISYHSVIIGISNLVIYFG